ncbi:MAG: helix-turn-helix transcriptional regulator [Clostridia bacterium]|nr:helix-turn-helix transcriptional regulator [Clostridia bacterium]
MNNIGQRIKALRKKNGMTQERLADHLGVTDKAVSKWECGLTAPDLALIMPLARVLQVSADELLGGKQEEIDERRAEFDERCDHHLKYDTRENYQLARMAVNEYPTDYKYLSWLALCEMYVAYCSEYKDDPTAPFSAEMMECAIKHNNTVIAECEDTKIREKAIWNAMVCHANMGRHDEALKYAEMFPQEAPLTRDKAMELCLQGDRLTEYRKWSAYRQLRNLCAALSRIYWFAESGEPYGIAALDAEETMIETAFPDGNYLDFHKNLCCIYQKRAEFAVRAGDCGKAVEYLRTMMANAQKIPGGEMRFTSGALAGLSVNFVQDNMLPYVINGVDDVNLPIPEQLKNRLKLEIFDPLRGREDFAALLG